METMSRLNASPVENAPERTFEGDLRGQSLAKVLRSGRALPLIEALRLTAQLLSVLAAGHQQGLVDGELKPDNLFLCERTDGTRYLKVLDFPATSRAADARADVYAAGLLLHAMLTGRDTIGGAEPVSRFAVEPIPLELDRVLLRALAKDPSARFQSAEDFRAALLEINEAQQRPSGWLQTSTFDARTWLGSPLNEASTTRSLDPQVLAPRLERELHAAEFVGPPSPWPAALARGVFLLSLLIAYTGTLALFVWLGRWLVWKG